MITKDIIPGDYQRYLSLPLLGSLLDDFAIFLGRLGYPPHLIHLRILKIPIIISRLKQNGCHSINTLSEKKLLACAPPLGHAKEDANVSVTVHLLNQFLHEKNVFHKQKPSQAEQKITEYAAYLEKTRGFVQSTIQLHRFTILQFLIFLKKRRKFPKLEKLTYRDVEVFLSEMAKRVRRGFLQHVIAHLRSFLRFLKITDAISLELGEQIDTPRVYREEKLPRAVSWEVVKEFLQSIDRSTALGKRDYAIVMLMTTYGVRASEVAALKLDDIDWKSNVINIFQTKTKDNLELPLTVDVGKSIIDYLKNGRPSVLYREIFARQSGRHSVLKSSSINNIFKRWGKRNGISTPIKNAHSLRHSYAVHLLRRGTSIKTIGDLLGHHGFESTCVYLRLNIEDLRAVPLLFPSALTERRVLS